MAEVGFPVREHKTEGDSPVVGAVRPVDFLAEAAQTDEDRFRAGP